MKGEEVYSHYEVLGVESSADLDAIKRAWHARIRLMHPDVHPRADEAARAAAATQTRLANDAWETLKDPVKRRQYDLQLAQRVDAATRAGMHAALGPDAAAAKGRLRSRDLRRVRCGAARDRER